MRSTNLRFILFLTLIFYSSLVRSEDYNEILRSTWQEIQSLEREIRQDIPLFERDILESNDIDLENGFDDHSRFKRQLNLNCICPPGPEGDPGLPGYPGLPGIKGKAMVSKSEIASIIDRAADVCPRVC